MTLLVVISTPALASEVSMKVSVRCARDGRECSGDQITTVRFDDPSVPRKGWRDWFCFPGKAQRCCEEELEERLCWKWRETVHFRRSPFSLQLDGSTSVHLFNMAPFALLLLLSQTFTDAFSVSSHSRRLTPMSASVASRQRRVTSLCSSAFASVETGKAEDRYLNDEQVRSGLVWCGMCIIWQILSAAS